MSVSNIGKGALISYLSIFINIVISFVYTPWMIHKIGASHYGLYSLVIAFVSYFLLDFGLNTSTSRFIAKYRAEGDEDGVAKMLGLTIKVYFIIDAVIFVTLFIMYFFIQNIFKGLTSNEIETLRGIYIIAAIFSVLSFALKPIDGAMMAYEYFVPNKILDMIHRVGSVILIAVLLMIGGDVYSLVLVHCGTAFLSSLFKFILFVRKSKLKIQWHFFDKSFLKILLSFSGWVFLTGLAQRFRLSFVPTVLGIQSNSSEIAIFSIGLTIEGFVWTISHALNGLFLPKVTRLSQQSKDRKIISELMIRVGRIQYYITLFLFSGFVFFGKKFVCCWVGEEFSNSYYVILFLIAPNIITTTQSIASDVVYAENKVRFTASAIFVTSLIGLVGSLVVAPYWGALGCAACTSIVMFCYLFYVNLFYQKNLNLDIVTFFRQCHLLITLKMLFTLIVGFFLFLYIPVSGWGSFFLVVGVYSISFVLNAYFISFNKEEKSIVINIIGRK